jgi:hypothetical protein
MMSWSWRIILEGQLHLIFKQSVMNELLDEGYLLYAEPLGSPVNRISWSAYRPDILGLQVTHNTFKLVFVECETAPTKTRVNHKTERIRTSFHFQKRLYESHQLRSLLIIPPLTLNKINCKTIRSFWEIWIINHKGTIIHKIPDKSRLK